MRGEKAMLKIMVINKIWKKYTRNSNDAFTFLFLQFLFTYNIDDISHFINLKDLLKSDVS